MKKILALCIICTVLVTTTIIKAKSLDGEEFFNALGCSCLDDNMFQCKKTSLTKDGWKVTVKPAVFIKDYTKMKKEKNFDYFVYIIKIKADAEYKKNEVMQWSMDKFCKKNR